MTLQEILSAPQAGFSGLYTPSPMSGTDVVNGAFQEEAVKDYRQQQAQQVQQNLIDRARAEAVREDPTLNFVQRRIAQGLLGAKQAYDVANANGNAAGMEAASKVAQGLRKQASSIGWDSGDYGPDVSLEVAAQNMANNDTKAINNLLYGSMNPNAYYKKTMQDYIDMGANRKTAARLAQEDTEEYHSGRFNDMMDSFYMYGMDDRGAINSNGVRILSMMASEDGTSPSEIASYISKMNASPRDNWNFENSMLMTDKGLRDSLTKMARQYQYGQQAADAAQQRRMESEERQNQQRKEFALFTAGLQAQTRNMERAEKEAYVKQQYLKLTGGNEEVADQMTAQFMLGLNNGRSGSSKESGDEKLSSSQQTQANEIKNKYSRAMESRSAKDVDDFEAYVKEHRDKLDPDDARKLDYMLYALKGYEAKGRSDDDAASEFWKKIPAKIRKRLIPNENFDAYDE